MRTSVDLLVRRQEEFRILGITFAILTACMLLTACAAPDPVGTVPQNPLKSTGPLTFVVIGDSTSSGGATATVWDSVWEYQASFISFGSFIPINNAASGGFTCNDDDTQNLTAAISYAPQAIIIDCGINGYGHGRTAAQEVASIDDMVTHIQAAGIKVILTNVLPNNSGDPLAYAYVSSINSLIATYAYQHEIPLMDFWTPMQDPANPGHYISGYTSDGTHPTQLGDRIIPQKAVAPVLWGTTPNKTLIPYLAQMPTDPFNLVADATMTTGTTGTNSSIGDPTGVVPTGWQEYSSGTTHMSLATDSSVVGNWIQFAGTSGSTGGIVEQLTAITSGFSVGDTVAFSGRFSASGTEAGGMNYFVGLRFYNAATYIGQLAPIVSLQVDESGTWYIIGTVPATTTSMKVLLGVGAGAGTVHFGQVGVVDFTQNPAAGSFSSLNTPTAVNAADLFGTLSTPFKPEPLGIRGAPVGGVSANIGHI